MLALTASKKNKANKKAAEAAFSILKTEPLSMAVVLNAGCPQASKAVIINRGLPGQKFFHCQRITRTGFLKA
jgi:hypothetical protein